MRCSAFGNTARKAQRKKKRKAAPCVARGFHAWEIDKSRTFDVKQEAGYPTSVPALRRRGDHADMSDAFALDPALERDSVLVGHSNAGQVRLHRDARWPWLLLIPERARPARAS